MKRIVAFLVIIISVIPLIAQNRRGNIVSRGNEYNIDDRLYEIYCRADKARPSSECLAICDTLINEAVRLGDGKAECMAYVLKMFYWSQQRNIDELVAAADKVREVSRNNNFPQYYYIAYSQQSVTYINLQKFDEAKKVINKMYADALHDDSPYGLWSCYIQNAHLYNFQGSFHKAVTEYVKAAEYMADNLPDQSPSNTYLQASNACLQDNNPEKALFYSKKGLEYFCDSKTKIKLYENQGVSLFILGRVDEFKKVYGKFDDCIRESGMDPEDGGVFITAAKYSLDGDYDKALLILKDANSLLKYPMQKIIYESTGDYRNAMIQADSSLLLIKNYYQQTVEMSTAEMTGLLDTERLEAEKKELELKSKLQKRRLTIFSLCILILLGGFILGIIIQNKRKHIKLLLQANAIKDKFVKNISHEVRTPLNAVVGYSQMLTDQGAISPKEREEFVNAITENGEALACLIDDILSASDMLDGKYNLNIADTNLMNICRSAVKISEKRLPKGVSMHLDTEIAEDLTVRTDAVHIQQILINLLNNSCKNTESGSITLSCHIVGDRMIFKVIDTGRGIPADKAEQIFEPFYKIDQFKQGVGLGLSISRDIATRLGGTLELDTKHDSGALFILNLPVK